MVFDKIGRPSILLHRKLAFKNPAPQIRYGPGNLPEPFAARSEINIGIPEIEHHGKIAVFPNKRLELVIWHARRFRYGHAIIPRKSLPTQLPEKFPESRLIAAGFDAFGHAVVAVRFPIRPGLVFFKKIDRIQPETRDAPFKPSIDHAIQLPAQSRIFPIEVRLLLAKRVKIVFLPPGDFLPHTAAKHGTPIVGRALAGFKNIVVMVRTVRVGQRLLKPRMFVRGMVNNQIHQDTDAHPFGLCDERFEILHGAKFGRQGRIIGNVVAVVRHWGFVYGTKPQQRDPQVFEIRQLLKDARKISDAISIAVAETFRVNLIDNFFLPPFLLHNGASLRSHRSNAMHLAGMESTSVSCTILSQEVPSDKWQYVRNACYLHGAINHPEYGPPSALPWVGNR